MAVTHLGDNRLCILQNAASTYGDYVDFLLTSSHPMTWSVQKKIDELELEAAQVLTSGFGASLEQFACEFPDLDLYKFSVYNKVVDGKIMPST